MPRYRFKVADAKGKVKTGYVGAPDEATAQARLMKAGYYVLELESGDGDSPSLQIKSSTPKSGFVQIERAPMRGYQPSLWERVTDFSIDAQTRNMGLIALAVLGLLVALVTGFAGKKDARTAATEVEYETVKLAVRGRVVPPDGSLQGVSLIFHLPEVPLDVRKELDEIATGEKGDFLWEYEFMAPRSPNLVSLTVSKEGYQDAQLDRVPLRGDPLTCDLPTVVLKEN